MYQCGDIYSHSKIKTAMSIIPQVQRNKHLHLPNERQSRQPLSKDTSAIYHRLCLD